MDIQVNTLGRGLLILLVGPPGVGKGTLYKHLKEKYPHLTYPTSATTRAKRPGEVDGETYFFLTKEEFNRRIAQGDFVEWVEIDGGNCYGTLVSELLKPLENGNIVVRELEVMGAKRYKELVPKESLRTIYIGAGSWEELKARILARAPTSEDELENRRKRYEYEKEFENEADYVIMNESGKLKDAYAKLDAIMDSILQENQS